MSSTDQLESLIQRAIKDQIAKIVVEEAKAASERVERRVRDDAVGIATRVLTHFQFERFGPDIRIHVKFDGTKT